MLRERMLDLPELQPGLTMEEEFLVKLFGSFHDPLLVLSSYPPKDPKSTVHLSYGTTNDLSNISMFFLYTKLGFNNATMRSSGMLHVDVFSRRTDRMVTIGSGIPVIQKMPQVLREFWAEWAFLCLARSIVKFEASIRIPTLQCRAASFACRGARTFISACRAYAIHRCRK